MSSFWQFLTVKWQFSGGSDLKVAYTESRSGTIGVENKPAEQWELWKDCRLSRKPLLVCGETCCCRMHWFPCPSLKHKHMIHATQTCDLWQIKHLICLFLDKPLPKWIKRLIWSWKLVFCFRSIFYLSAFLFISQVLSRFDPPKNCHLNVKKLPKLDIFFQKIANGNFFFKW